MKITLTKNIELHSATVYMKIKKNVKCIDIQDYLKGKRFNDKLLNNRINEMKAAEHNAIITKRISEQMEDIAYEQKALSDKQRMRAEEQSRIADIERGKAELERGLAVKAEQQARASAQEAETMRLIAEQQSVLATQHMEEALQARSHADTLFYQSLARSLAQTSITQYKSGDKSLAALLAYSAWYYTDKFKGNVYHQDIYTSLLVRGANFWSRIWYESSERHLLWHTSQLYYLVGF